MKTKIQCAKCIYAGFGFFITLCSNSLLLNLRTRIGPFLRRSKSRSLRSLLRALVIVLCYHRDSSSLFMLAGLSVACVQDFCEAFSAFIYSRAHRTMGMCSEKFVIRRFRPPANIIECTLHRPRWDHPLP